MNSVCFILWIFFAYKKIAPNSYLHTEELFHWNTQQCKKETTQILWDCNGSKSFCTSASPEQELALTEQPQGWQKCPCCFWGALCCWACLCLGCGQRGLCTEWLCGFLVQEKLASKSLSPEVGFSLSARCPGIMYNTWQQFSWKTTGAYVCDYTYVCAHMHACIAIFIVLCLHT